MLAITLTRNLPINRALLAVQNTPDGQLEFAVLRSRWDRLHTVRNVLNISGLALAITGAISRPGARGYP